MRVGGVHAIFSWSHGQDNVFRSHSENCSIHLLSVAGVNEIFSWSLGEDDFVK